MNTNQRPDGDYFLFRGPIHLIHIFTVTAGIGLAIALCKELGIARGFFCSLAVAAVFAAIVKRSLLSAVWAIIAVVIAVLSLPVLEPNEEGQARAQCIYNL